MHMGFACLETSDSCAPRGVTPFTWERTAPLSTEAELCLVVCIRDASVCAFQLNWVSLAELPGGSERGVPLYDLIHGIAFASL